MERAGSLAILAMLVMLGTDEGTSLLADTTVSSRKEFSLESLPATLTCITVVDCPPGHDSSTDSSTDSESQSPLLESLS